MLLKGGLHQEVAPGKDLHQASTEESLIYYRAQWQNIGIPKLTFTVYLLIPYLLPDVLQLPVSVSSLARDGW